jgi:hypothetical protein
VPGPCAAGRTGADRLPATAAAPLFRGSVANPINDTTTGGKHNATTFMACSNLLIFRISRLTSSFSRLRRTDQTW